MSLIDNMVAAIHGIKEKYPEPPQTQIKMHPNDFRACVVSNTCMWAILQRHTPYMA